MPRSRAMAKSSLLALVMLALDPLMKQTLSIKLKMVAAARLFVAWRTISTIGIPVDVDSITSGSVRQKRITRMKHEPLYTSVLSLKVICRIVFLYLRDSSNTYSVNHGSRSISRRIRHFFCHVQYDIEGYEREG